MNHRVTLTPPETRPRRTIGLNIRLTPEEYAQVEQVAGYLDVRVATMTRHFLMLAVASYIDQPPEA